MAADPCSRCGEKTRVKLGSVYVSYYPDRDHRVAYLLKLDPVCTADLLVPLLTREVEDLSNCPECHQELGDDVAKTFLTIYLPHKDQYDDRIDTCLDGCAAQLRERLTFGGKLQPDRGVEVRGPSPSQAAWDAIPI